MPLTPRMKFSGGERIEPHEQPPTLETCPPTCFHTGHDDRIRKYYVTNRKKKNQNTWHLKKILMRNIHLSLML